MRGLLMTLVLASLALPSCGPGGPTTYMGHTLAEAKAAQEKTFVAVRTYHDYVGVQAGWYKERFVKGSGKTKAELLELNGSALEQLSSAGDIEAFKNLATRFQGGYGSFIAETRDFRVLDFDLFDQNYTYVIFNTTAKVAGRLVYVADVKPNVLDRPWYTVWVDQETLVTLKYLEFLPSGALAAEMETLSIQYDPDLSNEVFPTLGHSGLTEVDHAQVSSFVAFEVFTPNYLPTGFVHQSTEISSMAGTQTVSFSFSDGLQRLFMVQLDAPAIMPIVPADEDPNITIRGRRVGGTSYADVILLGTQVHMCCKVEREELTTIIEHLDVAGL